MGIAITKAKIREELEKFQVDLQQGKLEDVTSKMNQELTALENTTLTIAITGCSGAGKSSLVNALGGMSDYEKDSAKTGVTETTMDMKGYTHPNFSKVIIWDLPGIGTVNFKAGEYLKDINFSRYDIFIIASGGRFTEADVMLAQEIKKLKKNFYYVCTKVDVSINSEKRNPNFNEQETLNQIKKYCCENLQKAGEPSPRVFVVSTHDLDKYDFPLLQETLATELGDLKREVFIMAWSAFSKEAINQKKSAMKDLILKLAFVSCAIGVVSIPGLSLECNTTILVSTMIKMYHVFGLDEDSLHRLERHVGKPIAELKSAIKNVPNPGDLTTQFLIDNLQKSKFWVTTSVIEIVLDFIPVLGSLCGGVASFVTTYYMLNNFLEDVVKDAENVRAKAFDS